MGYQAGFKINGIPIKNPTDWKVEVYTLTQSARVANGDMVMDFVANKRKFTFTYAQISSTDLDVIIEQLWSNLENTKECFHTLEYPDNGTIKTATVYAGSIPRNLHRGIGSVWVWKEVSFSLIER